MLVLTDDPAAALAVELLTPRGEPLSPLRRSEGEWDFNLPETGDYTLVLLGRGERTITIIIPPLEPISAPAPATCTRIRFAPGATAFDFTVDLARYKPRCYVVRALEGQQMIITAVGEFSRPFVAVFGPSGRFMVLSRPEGMVDHWMVDLPQTGDYTVVLTGEGTTWVTIEIPPR